jgi:hypothetical protein
MLLAPDPVSVTMPIRAYCFDREVATAGRTGRSRSGTMHGRGRPHERDIDPPCAEGSPLSALVGVDGAASVAERALDLLAPAALSTVAAKTTEHMIEDIVAMSGLMTLWACQFPIAVAVRARGLRHDRCSFPCFTPRIWERGAPIDARVSGAGAQGGSTLLGRSVKTVAIWRGTGSSNPFRSSRQSVSRGISPSCVEKAAVAAACAGPDRRHSRQRRAGLVNITPTAP